MQAMQKFIVQRIIPKTGARHGKDQLYPPQNSQLLRHGFLIEVHLIGDLHDAHCLVGMDGRHDCHAGRMIDGMV